MNDSGNLMAYHMQDSLDTLLYVMHDEDQIDYYGNQYIEKVMHESKLQLLQINLINKWYKSNGILGLFHLFLNQSLFSKIHSWTSQHLVLNNPQEGSKLSLSKIKVAIGLEIGASMLKMNSMKDYWEEGSFPGHDDFKSTMLYTEFSKIRASPICLSWTGPWSKRQVHCSERQ